MNSPLIKVLEEWFGAWTTELGMWACLVHADEELKFELKFVSTPVISILVALGNNDIDALMGSWAILVALGSNDIDTFVGSWAVDE